MSLFIASAYAQEAGKSAPGGEMLQILFLVGLFAMFYFIAIRPQRKRQKEHTDMVSKLNKGDEVVTSSGILGRVTALDRGVNGRPRRQREVPLESTNPTITPRICCGVPRLSQCSKEDGLPESKARTRRSVSAQ